MHGLWSYSIATALMAEPRETSFASWSRSVAALFESGAGPLLGELKRQFNGPGFVSSHPTRPLLATSAPAPERAPAAQRGGDARRIELTKPALQRGVALAATRTLQIEGRVVAPVPPARIFANGALGQVNPDGSFSLQLPLPRGESRIGLYAWWSDQDFVPLTFTVVMNEQGQAAPGGRQLALVFANQGYRDEAFGRLETPHGDADALVAELRGRYGFETEIQTARGRQSLVFKDSGREAMLRALSLLRSELRQQDSLLVFFAGHGIFERETGLAYWLPVDAERNEPLTWVSSQDVHNAISRLHARHVLVVADSCFSGGFIQRSAAEAAAPDTDRLQFLGQMGARPSRRFITSGANEPVADGGGRGHSVFARALLDGLRAERQPFTASELFLRHLQGRVGGAAKQLPQNFPMKEGHEGGDLVFFPGAAARSQP